MVLVSGGTGFVGAHLLLELLKNNQKVRAIIRSGSDLALTKKIFSFYHADYELLLSQIEWVEGELLDIFTLQDAMNGVDKIYHCAAVVSFNPKDRDNLYKTNIKGTENMVNAALQAKIKKLCFVSSIAAIGRTDNNELITEETEWKASGRNSNYAISKYGAEREVWRGTEEGLDAVIVNPSVIIGPGDWNSGSAKIFHTLGKGSRFYTNGINGFVDVRDVVSAMYQLMESNIVNQRFILSSENLSYRELFTLILKEYGMKPPTIKAGRLLLEAAWRFEKIRGSLYNHRPLITKETVNTSQNQYFYSTEKLQKAINFQFKPIEDIISLTAKLYLKEKK